MKKMHMISLGNNRDLHKEIMPVWAVTSQRQIEGPHKEDMLSGIKQD